MKLNKLDEIAKKYDPSSPKKDFDYWLIKFDCEEAKKFIIGDKILELGCGRGIITEQLTKIAREVVVVEGSKENISYVKEKLKNCHNVKFYHSLWQDFEYHRRDISDIIFFSGLEHINEKTAIEVLEKIRRYLRQNGRLHVIVPNARSLHRKVAQYMGIIKDVYEFSERDKAFGHKKIYDKEMLFSLLERCGYKIFHWEGIFLKPLTNSMMMNFNKKIIRGFYEIGKELPDYCAHIYVVATT